MMEAQQFKAGGAGFKLLSLYHSPIILTSTRLRRRPSNSP
jgi:hypothetical protein